MKNFNYVMVLATLFASIVSTHALPVGDGVMMRVPDPTDIIKRGLYEVHDLKKHKGSGAGNSISTVLNSTTTASNSTVSISNSTSTVSNSTAAAGGKKDKGAGEAGKDKGKGKEDTNKAGKGPANSQADTQAGAADNSGGNAVANIIQGLTGVDVRSLGIQDHPLLEARKRKQHGRTAAAGAGTGTVNVGAGEAV